MPGRRTETLPRILPDHQSIPLRFVLALALALLALPTFSQQQPDLEGARRTIAAIEELLEQRPTDATLYFFLSRFKADVGDKAGSVTALEKVDELGDGYLPTKEFGFAAVWDHPPFQAARSKIEAKLPRLDFAPTAFQLDDRGLIPEGIAHDPHSRRFYIGSIAQKRVVQVDPEGGMTEFAGPAAKLDEVLGLAMELDLASRDAGDVEQAIDEPGQVRGRAFDDANRLPRALGPRLR